MNVVRVINLEMSISRVVSHFLTKPAKGGIPAKLANINMVVNKGSLLLITLSNVFRFRFFKIIITTTVDTQ